MTKKSHIIIALGSNSEPQLNLTSACNELRTLLPGIRMTEAIWTDPIDMMSPQFINCIAEGETSLSLQQLQHMFKQLELKYGDSRELRQQNIVKLDIDLLLYGERRLHQKDWMRPYIIKLMATLVMLLFLSILPSFAQRGTSSASTQSDAEALGRAIEYFQSGKYHESLVLFTQLDKSYKLNPRFQAYIGVCYFYEWEYEKTIEYIDTLLPRLDVFAPHERSLYYFACAESHFNLAHYEQAIPLYEQFLLLCYDNEKPDALFRLGFCHMFTYDNASAYEYFKAAEIYFSRYRSSDEQGRLAQTRQMIKGLEDKLIRQGGYFVYDQP